MGMKDGQGVEGVSHGICDECLDKMLLELLENREPVPA